MAVEDSFQSSRVRPDFSDINNPEDGAGINTIFPYLLLAKNPELFSIVATELEGEPSPDVDTITIDLGDIQSVQKSTYGETNLISLGYTEAKAGVVKIGDQEYKFNPWTNVSSHQDNNRETAKNSILFKELAENNIQYQVIDTGLSQTLYVKYPSEPSANS